MKKILLFICMVICAVGTKAYTTGKSFSKTYYVTYSKSSTSGSTNTYSLSINQMVQDMSSTNCGKYKMNAPTVTYIKRNETILSCGSYLNPGGLGYYMFHGANVYSSGSDDSKYLTSKLKIEYADCWEYTDDASDYIRFVYPTYETSAYTFEYGMVYTDEHANTYNLKIVVNPVNKPTFVTGNYTTTASTGKTIMYTTATSGSTVYLSNSTQVTPSVSVVSAKTFSGSTISSGYSVTTPSQVGSNNYYYYSTTFKATTPGTYVLKATSSTWSSYSTTYTITVNRKSNTLAFTNQSFDAKQGKKSFDLASAISTNPSSGAITYSCTDANATISNGKLTVKKPGAYTITANQEQTYIYAAGTKTFTITASASKLEKVHSCIINDYQMSEWYDGAARNEWTSNTPNLRYVNSANLLNSESYIRSGLETLSDNHTVVKFSDAPSTAIESTRLLLDNDNKIVSTNPTFSEADKYDFVVPENATIGYKSGLGDQTVTFVRTEAIPSPGHYSTICLPFSVPAGNAIFNDFAFEKHVNSTPEATENPSTFNFAFTALASGEGLVAGRPYVFTKKAESSATKVEISVPLSETTFASQPETSDPMFFGTYINLITKDLQGNTATNPYNNGNTSISLTELDGYFDAMLDNTNKRVAWLIRPVEDHDEIRRAGSGTSMRPFRGYFRFNNGDFSGSSQAAKLVVVHLDADDDDATAITTVSNKREDGYVDVYTLSGTLVAKHREVSKALSGLQSGTYVLSNGKKVIK